MRVSDLPLTTDVAGLPLALANGIGVVAVVVIVGWLVWSGRLVPGPTYQKHVDLLNDQLADERHEKGEWRTEARLKDQTVSELSEQNRAMLHAFGPTLTDFLTSLRRAGVGPANGGDDERDAPA